MSGLFDDLIPAARAEGGNVEPKPPAAPAKASGLFDDLVPETPKRTWGEFGKDIALAGAQGFDAVAKLPAMAYDKATTGNWFGPETQAISAMSDERESLKSAHSQQKTREKAQTAQAAGEAARELVGDGAMGTAAQVAAEFGSSFLESLKDPASLPEFAAQQAAQLGVMGKVGRGAEIAARTAAKAAPRLAATKVGQAVVANSGTAGAVGFGAGLQGVDVGSDTMQRLMALPDEQWAQNPDFVALSEKIGADTAKQRIASQLASEAALKAGAVSAVTAAMPGGTSVERALVGKHRGGYRAVPRAFAGEAAQEGAEEGSGQYFGNIAVQETNPDQHAFESVGAAAGQGAYLGGVLGGALHAGRVFADGAGPTTAEADAAPSPADPDASPAGGPLAAAELPQEPEGTPSPEDTTAPGVVWRNKDFDLPVEVVGQPEADQDGRQFVQVRGTIDGETSTSYVPVDELDGWTPPADEAPAAPKPSEQMGIDPAAGPLSKVAAASVDTAVDIYSPPSDGKAPPRAERPPGNSGTPSDPDRGSETRIFDSGARPGFDGIDAPQRQTTITPLSEFPFSHEGAQRIAASWSLRDGFDYQVTPHPSMPDRFVVARAGVEDASPAPSTTTPPQDLAAIAPAITPDMASERIDRPWTTFADGYGSLDVPQRAGIPLTESGARKRAADLTQRTGTPYEVVAHPVAQGRFMAAPLGADQQSAPAPDQGFQFSQQPGGPTAGVTSDTFRTSFRARMPGLSGALDTMFERGRRGEKGGLVLIESADPAVIAATVQQHTGQAAAQLNSVDADGHSGGLYDPQSGLTFLIGPNLSERTAPGVLMHEVVHGQQREKLDAAAQQLITGRDSAAPALRAFLDRVQERIDAAGAQGDPREAMPYVVEQAITEGRQQGFSAADTKFTDWVDRHLGKPVGNLVRALVMRVRAWAHGKGISLKTLYVDDLVAIAQSGMREAARGRVKLGNGPVQHSRATTEEAITTTAEQGHSTIKDWIAHHLQNHRGWALGALTRDQIADIFGRDMPAVRRFDEVVQAMDQERNARTETADKLVERWRALPKSQADRLADVMHAATLAQFDPDTFNATTTDEEAIKSTFNAMGTEARRIYRDVRDQYRATLVELRDSLGARVERAGSHGARAADEIRLKFDQYLKNGPYFSLARFGDLVLIADKGDERIVETFEGSLPRAKRQRELQARGFAVKLTARAEYSATKDGAAGEFVGDVLKRIDALDIDAADKARLMDGLNQLAINLLPDASYRKHFAHRKGTPGFSNDAMRAFAASQMHAAHHIAKIRHADELSLLIDEMQSDIRRATGDVDTTARQQVVNELKRRLDYLMNPTTHPVAAAAGQVGFVMSLGGSVASGLVNMTQTPLVTLPYLGAKHGFPKASAALMKASRDYFGGRWEKWSGFVLMKSPNLTLDEKGALRQLEVAGLINLTQMHDLAGTANADSTVSRRAWAINRAMKIIGWTFHVPEVFNRQVSALAAFRLAKEAGQDNEGAIEYARQALIRTHFDYSASNRARFMQGNFTRVITMFKQYSQQMTYLLWRNAYQALKGESAEVRREARRMLIGVAATHFAAAGTLGLPLGVFGVPPLLSLLALGMGDEDDPYDWEVEYRQMLADVFGKAGGEMIAKGPLRAVLNVDLASRVGLGDLWVRAPLKEAEGRDLVEAWMLTLLGPVAGYAGQMGTAAKAFNEGKISRGVEAMMPKFVAAPLKALRYQSEGVRSWKGDALGIDLTPPDVIGVALGFQPSALAEMYEGRAAVKGRESRLQARRQEILNMWVASYMAGDRSGTTEAVQAARAFNDKNPEFWIKPDAFRKSYQAKMRNASQIQDGIHLSRRRESLRDEGRFANIQ